MAKQTETLYLFSSDFRELYLEDCLTVLAKPTGAIQRFRYQRKWVSLDETNGASDADWTALAKKGTPVEVYFVASVSKAYGRTVFVPLRRGKVVRAFAEGDFLFVDFEIGGYIKNAAGDKPAEREASAIATTEALRKSLGKDRYPKANYGGKGDEGLFSVVLTKTATTTAVVADAEASSQFVATAKYLDDHIGDAKHHLTFMRFLGVRPAWPNSSSRAELENGSYPLDAGRQYQLDTLQFNASSADGTSVQLTLPSMLATASETSAELASPYDLTTFTFVSAAKENDNRGEILSEIRLGDPAIELPKVRVSVPVLVRPRLRFTVLNWALVVGATFGSFLLTLGSLKGLIFTPPTDDPAQYWDWSIGDLYMGAVPGAVLVASAAAIASGVAAAGAVFRRRFGLDAK